MARKESGTVRPTKRKRVFFAAAVLLIVCVLAAGAVSADTVTVSNYEQLSKNISNDQDDLTIIIAENISVGADQGFSVSKNITLTTTAYANYTLYRTEANTTNGNGMFTVANEGNLTILGNNSHTLTLDGNKTALSENGQTLVWINNGGNFTLDDGGVLTNNSVKGEGANGEKKRGGAVYVNGGTFTMSGGTISRNTAEDYGGGVYLASGTFKMSDGVIGGEEKDGNSAFHGGGVCVYSGTFEMSGGTISGNNATGNHGGGVYIQSGTFTMKNGTISGNTALSNGGGVYLAGGAFTMDEGTISNNSAHHGGGVFLNGGEFTMNNGIIRKNTADEGGGAVSVYTNSARFQMNDGTLSENAAVYGGGVYIRNGCRFVMIDGEISNNTATGNGGGVNLYSSSANVFEMYGGTISGNTANKDGGGVGITNGQFTMFGGEISGNTATSNGTGVYVGGIFNIQESGTVKGVYLPKDKNITVTENLNDAAQVTGIIPADPQEGLLVVDLAKVSESYLSRFQLDESVKNFALKYQQDEPRSLVLTRTHTVTFEENGGTSVPDKTVNHGDTVNEPDDPAKDDYTFAGWHKDTTCTQPWTFDTDTVTSDLTLYAKWTPNKPGPTPVPPSGGGSSDGNMDNAYRVLFNDGATTLSVVTDLSAGDKLTKPEDPVKDGYTFAGWHKDTACTQPWDFNDGITGDMTLYAKWTPQETVTPTATATPTVTATATITSTPTGDASPAPTSQPDTNGNNGDTTNGETTATSGISLPYLIGGIAILLLAILLLLFLLLRHTVTFLIPAGGELEEYRIKVWHGRYIDPGQLPELLRTAAWYRDPARQERWDFNEDRVTKSIELYIG
ncbi:MAG TPA: InlB B-repeat-containing protein [Methanocorpusculum sp.]|nr:InlB B-repeat-containing protein [Methanocorpusculum sp.]